MNKFCLRWWLALGILCTLSACNKQYYTDPTPEDYNKLFPFKGIDKPQSWLEDMVVQLCDPSVALEAYRYPGVEISPEAQREYDVVITCRYSAEVGGRDVPRFVVRYIDEHKAIREVGSAPSFEPQDHRLELGKEWQRRFKVRSGYPLYLSVNGVGPRHSSIKASIIATSADGTIVVGPLSSQQYQNSEGPNNVPNPYCEYIILP